MFGIDTQQGTVVSLCLLNMHELVSETFAFLFYLFLFSLLCFVLLCVFFFILQMFNECWQFFFHLLGEGRTRGTNYSLLSHECHRPNRLTQAAFTRTLFHLKPHRFRCGYAFCLHDTDRDRCRNRVDLKTLPKVERFQNDTDLSDV